MAKNTHELIESQGFKSLVRRKWTVSIVLTLLLFVVYYGFILLIAFDKPAMARKVGEVTTLGIPLGIAVILLAWLLTGIYVAWANGHHDADVRKLRDEFKA